MMRLCEVRGCTGTAVGLVRVKLPGWRVAEPRRVCARHHRELAPAGAKEDTVDEKTRMEMEKLREQLSSVTRERDDALAHALEASVLAEEDNAAERQAWASLVVELDEMATPETVEGLSESELRLMLTRWKVNQDQLRGAASAALEQELAASTAKVAALEKQLYQEQARGAGLEDERHDMRDDIAVAATLLRLAQEEMEDMHNRSARIVGIMLGSALDALEGNR